MSSIRPCREDEHPAILAIVNAAAEAYRDVIPADRWHEPYMGAARAEGEIASGVEFWGYEADGALIGVMGIQPVGDVDLIRHAYVLPSARDAASAGSCSGTCGPERAAHAGRHLGGRRVGDPLLSPQRLRAGRAGAQDELLKAYWTSRSARSRRRWCWRTRRSPVRVPGVRIGHAELGLQLDAERRADPSPTPAGPISETLTGRPLRGRRPRAARRRGSPSSSSSA